MAEYRPRSGRRQNNVGAAPRGRPVPELEHSKRAHLRLYDKQKAFVEDAVRYTLCEAGTKSGKTLGCAVWLLDNALREDDTLWWWVAPTRAQAMIAFELMVHGDRLND